MNTRTWFDDLLTGIIPFLLIVLLLTTQLQSNEPIINFFSGMLTGMVIAISVVVVWRWASTSKTKSSK